MIDNLETGQIEKNNKYSVTKETLNGSAKGIDIARKINKTFPDLVPAISGLLKGASVVESLGLALGIASGSAISIPGLGIIALWAGIGALVGGTAALIKNSQYKQVMPEAKVR